MNIWSCLIEWFATFELCWTVNNLQCSYKLPSSYIIISQTIFWTFTFTYFVIFQGWQNAKWFKNELVICVKALFWAIYWRVCAFDAVVWNVEILFEIILKARHGLERLFRIRHRFLKTFWHPPRFLKFLNKL